MELDLAIPISDEHLQRSDLWVSVCHAGACAQEVHLEWSCEGDFTCKLACEASAKLLGGEITARRGGPCPGSDRLCVEIELPATGLEPGNTDVAVTLDDAVSGRRLVDRTFSVELTERTARTCSGVDVCLQGESNEVVAAFDPATAPAGAHQVTLATASRSVSAGERHSCGTRDDGTLACWGALPGPPGHVVIPSDAFQSVGVGYLVDCALGLDGIVSCFGNSFLAEEGLAPPPGRFREVAVGSSWACGIRPSGRVECWGGNACTLPRSSWSEESEPIEHIVVSSSGQTLCALLADGRARCTGDWDLELEDATRVVVNADRLCRLSADGSAHCRTQESDDWVVELGPFVELVMGDDHVCGLAADGSVRCWGNDVTLTAATPADTFEQLDSGAAHVCGITSAGAAVCWGANDGGESTPPADFP